jgi:pyruvate/2-oxoglutarate/acetoin dehydrogenase E1 component
MKYFKNLQKSMSYLSKKEKVIFLGQAVKYEGTAMSKTLQDIKKDKLLELPVAEEMQMGMTLGLAMDGYIPVSIFPRWNFLLLAMNQLVNHLDKILIMSNSGFSPRIIIRTSVGSIRPLNPHVQHIGDFSLVIKKMCKNINVISLQESNKIFSEYKKALTRQDKKISILVEHGDYYNER